MIAVWLEDSGGGYARRNTTGKKKMPEELDEIDYIQQWIAIWWWMVLSFVIVNTRSVRDSIHVEFARYRKINVA